ncbi:RnfABCDGE type electron transport complex subunit G [Magnetospira thiophila]
MTQPSPDSPRPNTSPFPLIVALGGVATLSGFLIVLVFQLTRPYIAENQRVAIEQSIFQVVPGAVEQRKFVVSDKGVFPFEDGRDGTLIYAGYDADGQLLGIAAKAAAQGYADIITLLYGYDPECECIRGIRILKMAETPGLGDKIKTDLKFQKNFESLDATLNDERTALENAIVTVKSGSKWHDWQIDAISGATISSRAVGKALNGSAQALLPQLVRHLDVLRQGPPPPTGAGSLP